MNAKNRGGINKFVTNQPIGRFKRHKHQRKKISVRRKNDYENTHSQSRVIKKPHKAAFYRGDTPAMTAQS
jgi:hypothetical protein